MSNQWRKAAEQVALGIADAAAKVIVFVVVVNFLWGTTESALGFNADVDPTDKDAAHRSGLHYYHDYGTGREYISTGPGAPLTERVAK